MQIFVYFTFSKVSYSFKLSAIKLLKYCLVVDELEIQFTSYLVNHTDHPQSGIYLSFKA